MRTLAALILFLSVSASFAAEPVFPPGSRVGLVPPPGMTTAEGVAGFQDRQSGAVIAITEFSAQTFAKLEKEFSVEELRAGGMKEISRETMTLPQGEAQLVVANRIQDGVAMHKFALLAAGGDITAVVIAAIPEAAREAYPDAAIRAALASVTIRAKLSADEMLALLPYRLGDLGGFRVLRTSPNGTAVLTLGPSDTTLPAEQPFFMVAPRAVEPPAAAEREQFARLALSTFLKNPDLNVVSSEQIRIGGSLGHEIIAETKDTATGDDLMIVQWLRFDAGITQMFGMARKDRWADTLTAMRTVRDGFSRK